MIKGGESPFLFLKARRNIMIYESSPWKDDLKRTAKYLRELSCNKLGGSERRLVAIEKKIMLGFYSIRKLIEARKLTKRVELHHVNLNKYKYKVGGGCQIDLLSRHDMLRFYDLDTPVSETMLLKWVCDKFVHSYVFEYVVDSEGIFSAILFNSDKTRHEWLYEISVENVVYVFEEIALDGCSLFECKIKEDGRKKKDDMFIYRCE